MFGPFSFTGRNFVFSYTPSNKDDKDGGKLDVQQISGKGNGQIDQKSIGVIKKDGKPWMSAK